MPSQRKRIGFLPSEEVHEIIDKLCKANEFSQSKVTGILVEEALRSRGVLDDSFSLKKTDAFKFINESIGQETFAKDKKKQSYNEFLKVDEKSFNEDIKMIHEFIEFKYFKRIMIQNKGIFE